MKELELPPGFSASPLQLLSRWRLYDASGTSLNRESCIISRAVGFGVRREPCSFEGVPAVMASWLLSAFIKSRDCDSTGVLCRYVY